MLLEIESEWTKPDETVIPHRTRADPPAGGRGRSADGKMLIAGAVEVHDDGPGRVRLAPIADFSAASLHAFIEASVEAGATAKTDGWSRYTGAPGVTHDPHVVGPMAAHVVLPWAHRVFANLKTWALGVYHGLREKHLQSYLDEFAFRFNRRRTRHAAFRSLLGIAVALKHVTYNTLIHPEAQLIEILSREHKKLEKGGVEWLREYGSSAQRDLGFTFYMICRMLAQSTESSNACQQICKNQITAYLMANGVRFHEEVELRLTGFTQPMDWARGGRCWSESHSPVSNNRQKRISTLGTLRS